MEPVQTLNCSSFPGWRDDLHYQHITILSWSPAGNQSVSVLVQSGADFAFVLVSLCWLWYPPLRQYCPLRQCLEQRSCTKFLPQVPCLGFIVRNHKIKGQTMAYQPWLDAGWFVALEKPGMKSEAYWARTLPLAVGATNDFVNETGKAMTLVESIWWSKHLWAWFWLSQWCQSRLALQNNCTSDNIDMTWDIRVMSDLPEGIDFFYCCLWWFFWPPLCKHIWLHMQFKSFIYIPDWQIYWFMS